MTKIKTTAVRGTQSNRPAASRALMLRKAVEKQETPALLGERLEASFPAADFVGPLLPTRGDTSAETPADVVIADSTPTAKQTEPSVIATVPPPAPDLSAIAPEEASAPPAPAQPADRPAWSSEDEATLQGMMARRKASGFQRRGKDVSGQTIRVGAVAPNPGTVVATIVALVAERGTIGRSELLDAMATAAFRNAKAKPQDRGWCQGYVQGAVRDGFLALAAEVATTAEQKPVSAAASR